MDEATLGEIASSPWLYPFLFLLTLGDAFLVVLPSETLVVALGALRGATGSPPFAAIVPVATAGAFAGDLICFLIGRRVGFDRWRWQRRGPVAAAIARVRRTILDRPAVLVFTARYVPFARIAVNLSAGASGLAARRFVPLSLAACVAWAVYNSVVGLFFGAVLSEAPVLAIAIAVAFAIAIGVLTDAITTRVSSRRRQPEPDR